jgi:beta-glucosidase
MIVKPVNRRRAVGSGRAGHRPRSRRVRLMLVWLPACLALVAATAVSASAARDASGWGTGTLTGAEVRALVSQMTLAEEVSMIHGGSEAGFCSNTPPVFPVISPSVQGCVGQAGFNRGVARLGIPPLRQTDGPAGVRLSHHDTALPAPVGLTASFDRDAAGDYGLVIGREGRATNQDVLYAPMINQVSVPTGGRNFETLGEDPFLAGELVADEVRAVQGQGLIATLKHYAQNDFENARMQTSIAIDEQALHELELQAFQKGIDAGAGAVMCAYSRVNDVYSCSNDLLLKQILRDRWGFDGWVLSDFGATHRLSDLANGLDSAMPNGNAAGLRDEPDSGTLVDPGTGEPVHTLTAAVTGGTTAIPLSNNFPAVPALTAAQWKQALDDAVLHILTSMNRAGLLEGTQFGSRGGGCAPAATPPVDCTPFAPPRPDLETLKPADFAVARAVADKSATLLRNQGDALPLGAGDLRGNGLVVMGPTAVAAYVGGGGSAHVTPFEPVQSPYDALVAGAGPGARISFVPGYDLDGQLLPSSAVTAAAGGPFAGQSGWVRTQISTTIPPSGSPPDPCSSGSAADQLDPTIDHVGADALPPSTAWRWQSTFTAPSSGQWQLKVFVANQSSAQLFMDGLATNPNRRINLGAFGVSGGIGGSAVPAWDGLNQTQKSHDPALPKLQQGGFTISFAAGETHSLDLRAYASATDPLQVRFLWVPPDWQAQKIDQAVAAARSARTAVVFAYDDGTEGVDRGGNDQAAGLRLPGYQDALIAAVAAANPNTVVVLNTGDPVLMPWAGSVRSILEMWYPGQMGGPATADVLLGRVNPSGRLPVTFPADPAVMPTASAGCDPAAITTNPPNDGNCPLYPGVFQPGSISGNHSYKTIDYQTNGIFQGYRWYDLHGQTPLFPFGFGLSYTRFGYSKLRVVRAHDGGLDASFRVRNRGAVTGAEVPQVYLGPASEVPAGVQQAVRKLVQFTRITLAPGQERELTLHVAPRELSYWSATAHDWAVAKGTRQLLVGTSSRDLPLEAMVTVG